MMYCFAHNKQTHTHTYTLRLRSANCERIVKAKDENNLSSPSLQCNAVRPNERDILLSNAIFRAKKET